MTNQVKLTIVVLWAVAATTVIEAAMSGFGAFAAGALLASAVIGSLIVVARKSRRAVS